MDLETWERVFWTDFLMGSLKKKAIPVVLVSKSVLVSSSYGQVSFFEWMSFVALNE